MSKPQIIYVVVNTDEERQSASQKLSRAGYAVLKIINISKYPEIPVIIDDDSRYQKEWPSPIRSMLAMAYSLRTLDYVLGDPAPPPNFPQLIIAEYI